MNNPIIKISNKNRPISLQMMIKKHIYTLRSTNTEKDISEAWRNLMMI